VLTQETTPGLGLRIIDLIRWIAVRGIAAMAVGTVILGIGGRLVMLASRLLHPDAVGRATENGNRIGEFTVDGTIQLILFAGLLSGAAAGVIWAVVKGWIPARPVAVGLGAVAIGGFNLIEADNRDFIILGDVRLDLVLLLGLIFLFGAVLVPTDRWLDNRLPKAGSVTSIVVYTLLVALGAPLMIPIIGSYFATGFCFCENPPIWTGVFLLAAGLATTWWWVLSLRGSSSPPKYLKTMGSVSVALAVIAGAIHLLAQLIQIV
jgi:hypothetical protein